MAQVKMYADVEGDAKVGDVVTVSEERANLLVMEGKAIHVSPSGGEHLPTVGGARVKGTTIGVDPGEGVLETLLTPASQRDGEPLEMQTASEQREGGTYEAPEPEGEPEGIQALGGTTTKKATTTKK